jgi:ATP-dependent Lon protease
MASKTKPPDTSSTKIKEELSHMSNPNKLTEFVKSKISKIYQICENVIKSIQYYKSLELFSNSDFNVSNEMINDLHTKIKILSENQVDENSIESIQCIFDKLATMMSLFGSKNIDDIIYVAFGNSFKIATASDSLLCELYESKYDLIKKYTSFNGYKNVSSKIKNELKLDILCLDKKGTNILIEDSNQLECYEPINHLSSFYYSIFGIRIIIQNKGDKTTIVLNGTVEDIPIEWVHQNVFLNHKKQNIINHFKKKQNIDEALFDRLLQSLSIRDYLIYGINDIYEKYESVLKDAKYAKMTNIDTIVKNFKLMDTLNKRRFLMNLVLYNNDNEIQYIAYMLYDLISETKSSNETIDSAEQKLIFNSFSWKMRENFKDAMKNTVQYSNAISSKYDSNKITLEQQVFFMKAGDVIKEKAINKLKELKNKTEEQGGKIKQYLEGLLKIPFGIFKEETILTIVKDMNNKFIDLINDSSISHKFQDSKKIKYTVFEIHRYIQDIKPIVEDSIKNFLIEEIQKLNKSRLTDITRFIKGAESTIIKNNAGTKASMISNLIDYIKNINSKHNDDSLFETRYNIYKMLCQSLNPNYLHKYNNIIVIPNDIKIIKHKIKDISSALDNSIYGHKNAKTQILKIISQWINGENSGYCFGFEGSPGIGKTSLAKHGLAKCLIDNDGVSRPFSFMAMGGSCNGSTLEGHNYTYVNSSWGRIVDILMESKCLNPIIYIDELDKISKTEQGKEIVGILTHLIDSTQNDEFQDKYFSGIPIDLSKVLFIFSYNDPDQIDKILLDRIHRIKFDNLSTKDKLVVAKKFIIPNINKKMGFENVVQIEDDVIEYIIENYTMEPGIRKLKEMLFDLFGEINIELLNFNATSSIPINMGPLHVHKKDLGTKYIQKYKKIEEKKINNAPSVGVINGLWANNLGKGGIIPIEVLFFPCSSFLELKLTGMQGDVMKESMNIAKTVAWSLTAASVKKKIIKEIEPTKSQGIHVHCPDGATSKDGPSAGAAITLSIYSLFNNLPIIQTVAITGEINLQGEITAIGGLETKILGGIRAGVKFFMYPKANVLDFEECEIKYAQLFADKGIKFMQVSHIKEAMKYVYQE